MKTPRSNNAARCGLLGSVPLLPRHGIVVEGVSSPRFVRLFRKTWAMIPLAARRAILKHWRRRRPDGLALFLRHASPMQRAKIRAATRPSKRMNERRPTIRLSTRLRGAMVADLGHYVVFEAKFLDSLRPARACHVIAHELAHVYQYAIGTHDGMTYDGAEADAERLAKAWTKGGAK